MVVSYGGEPNALMQTEGNDTFFYRLCYLSGDVNLNKTVDAEDLALLLSAIENSAVLDKLPFEPMDLNVDGMVNAEDVAMLLSIIEGSI